jgi:hypothetical protein
MSNEAFNMPIIRTRSNAAALWDEGGNDGTTGRAVVVTGAYGERLRPFFMYRGDTRRANAKHALMPLYNGGYIVQIDLTPQEKTIRVLQVVRVEDDTAKVVLVAMSNGETWDEGKTPPKLLMAALEAAHTSATTYGNVAPGYIVDTQNEVV